MDFGGVERRTTKKDLKRKRIARGYKKGGKFRTANVDEESDVKIDKMGKVVGKKKAAKKRKY
jgi:hypothetical protein|tara:strand:+ start:213 stop:398 length:186 start_codon:yes stop_codon:yes gene_type:complete